MDLLSPSEIRSRYSFDRPAALLSRVGGEVDPLRLTHALLAAGLRDGLEIYDRTGVARYQSDRKGVLLETADGWRIRAGKAIFATGCNIPPFFPRRAIRLNSSFVVATSPLSGFEGWGDDRALVWETARPYLYARTTADNRALIGGADLPFKGARKLEKLQDRQTGRVAAQFAKLFPDIRFDVDWSWAGSLLAAISRWHRRVTISRLRSEMSVRAKVVSANSGTASTSDMSRRVKPIEPAPIIAILRGMKRLLQEAG